MFNEMVVSTDQFLAYIAGDRVTFDALRSAKTSEETYDDLVTPGVLDVWFRAFWAFPD